MSVQFKKNGVISTNNLYESSGANILINSEKYTEQTPYSITGINNDINVVTDMYAQVTPGETYYLLCEVNPEWADGHGYTENRKGKAIIWLYLSNAYNANNTSYDSAIAFSCDSNSNTYIANGIWKYTIPNNINMARIRLNTYSNGTDSVTCKFWNVQLISEKQYTTHLNDLSPSLKVGKDFIISTEIYEL